MACLRDLDLTVDGVEAGLCPVADLGPQPTSFNALAIEIYRQAQGSAQQVQSERKTFYYLHATDLEALMRVHGIPQPEQAKMNRRVRLLQDLENEMRPSRPLPSPRTRRRR